MRIKLICCCCYMLKLIVDAVPSFAENYLVYESQCVNVILEYGDEYKLKGQSLSRTVLFWTTISRTIMLHRLMK